MTIKILEHLYYFGFSNGILEKKHKKIVVRPDKNLEMYIKNIKKMKTRKIGQNIYKQHI